MKFLKNWFKFLKAEEIEVIEPVISVPTIKEVVKIDKVVKKNSNPPLREHQKDALIEIDKIIKKGSGKGNGQFLIWVLIRKISNNISPTEALKSIYGVDIFDENVEETRLRLLKVIYRCSGEFKKEHIKAVLKNIFCADLKNYPKGSLDYDFKFNHEVSKEDVDKYFEYANETFDKHIRSIKFPVEYLASKTIIRGFSARKNRSKKKRSFPAKIKLLSKNLLKEFINKINN